MARISAKTTEFLGHATLLLVIFAVHATDLSNYLSSNPIYLVAGLPQRWSGTLMAGQPGWIDWHAGATQQALGTLAAWDWTHKILPWWNPYVGVGLPLGAQPQSSAFFLPFILADHFFNGTLYLKVIMQVIAGQASYLLLRRLGVTISASVIGGVLYELNGMFAWFSDSPIMPLPFLPICILGVEHALTASSCKHRGGWCLIGVAISYLVLGGFPETAYLCGLMALVWSLVRFVPLGEARWRFAAKVVFGGLVGLMVALPMLLGFTEYLSEAWAQPRYTAYAKLIGGNYAMYLFPYLFGPLLYKGQYELWFRMGGYVGLTPLFLLLLGLINRGSDVILQRVMALWVIVALAKSAALPGVTQLVNLIPGVSQVMAFRYLAPTIAFAASVSSSLAINSLQLNQLKLRKRVVGLAWLGTVITSVCVVALSYPTLLELLSNKGYFWYPLTSILVPVMMVTVMAMLIMRRPGRVALTFLCGMVVCESVALFTIPLLSGAKFAEFDSAPVEFLKKNIGLNRYYSIGPIGPNYSSYFRIGSINHNYLPLSERWQQFVSSELDPGATPNIFNGTAPELNGRIAELRKRLPAYAQLGVKYVVSYHLSNPFAGLPDPIPREVFRDSLTSIYELPNSAPYFETVDGSCTLHDEGRQIVRGHCWTTSKLVRRELFFPGWSVTVNNKPSVLAPAGKIFQRVDLPAGDVFVQFRYAPPFVVYAYCTCLLGAIIIAAGVCIEVKELSRRRRTLNNP